MLRSPLPTVLSLAACTLCTLLASPISAPSIQVKVNRWLQVRQTTGQVSLQTKGRSQPATVGAKLQAIGDTARTAARSSVLLDLDTGIGFIKVAEKTTLQIKQLQTVRDGGQLTRLEVATGQAQLQLRPFTHKSSRLEVVTPAGVNSVRGTEFGVAAQPSGKTGLATLRGSVETSAQGQAVLVQGGFQTLTMPGEAPLPATPLKNDPSLDVSISPLSSRQVVFKGRTDAVNILLVNGEPQNTDRQGRFEVVVPILNQQVTATVITPLGKRQDYRFTRPQ